MVACCFMLKGFIILSFYSSPVTMKTYFFISRQRKASQRLDVKTDDNDVFCFVWIKIPDLGLAFSDN